MWTELAATETQSANLAARLLVLAIFAGLALLVGHTARRRRHPRAFLISLLGVAVFAGLVTYIRTMRPTARWSIWLIAAFGYGILFVWAYAGGSEPKSE